MAKEKRFVVIYTESLGSRQIIVDTETGVNYLLLTGYGITPLLDSDGKPVIMDEYQLREI